MACREVLLSAVAVDNTRVLPVLLVSLCAWDNTCVLPVSRSELRLARFFSAVFRVRALVTRCTRGCVVRHCVALCLALFF